MQKATTNPNLSLYERMREVPQEAKKTIGAGRLKGFTDVNPMWRIKQLTEIFGPSGFGWYTDLVDRWQEAYGNEVAVFVKIHLFVNLEGQWSQPIVGIGGSKIAVKERDGAYFTDEGWKMAYTDALSVACKALGMAADIYYEKDTRSIDSRTKYDLASDAMPVSTAAAANAAATAKPAFKDVPSEIYWQLIKAYCQGEPTKSGKSADEWYKQHTNAGQKEMDRFYTDAIDYKSTL